MDKNLAAFMADTAVSTTSFRSAARASRATGVLAETTAQDTEVRQMCRYMWSSRALFHNACVAYIVNDDIRVGGEKG